MACNALVMWRIKPWSQNWGPLWLRTRGSYILGIKLHQTPRLAILEDPEPCSPVGSGRAKSDLEMPDDVSATNDRPIFGGRDPSVGVAIESWGIIEGLVVGHFWPDLDLR